MNKAAGTAFALARFLLTVSAVAGGRILPRLFNIGVGRGLGKVGRRLWK